MFGPRQARIIKKPFPVLAVMLVSLLCGYACTAGVTSAPENKTFHTNYHDDPGQTEPKHFNLNQAFRGSGYGFKMQTYQWETNILMT